MSTKPINVLTMTVIGKKEQCITSWHKIQYMHYTKSKAKAQHFYFCSSFQSHREAFNMEQKLPYYCKFKMALAPVWAEFSAGGIFYPVCMHTFTVLVYLWTVLLLLIAFYLLQLWFNIKCRKVTLQIVFLLNLSIYRKSRGHTKLYYKAIHTWY